jgi:hypothetical protein
MDFPAPSAAEHQDQHDQPVTRGGLRARLGVSNLAASELLRQLRAGEGPPPGTSRTARPGCLPGPAGAFGPRWAGCVGIASTWPLCG